MSYETPTKYRNLLWDWSREKDIHPYCQLSIDVLPKKTMAQCTAQSTPPLIEASPKLMKMSSWCIESVLWHEFCHAWAYHTHGELCGHDKRFKGLVWTRPSYGIGFAVASFLWGFY